MRHPLSLSIRAGLAIVLILSLAGCREDNGKSDESDSDKPDKPVLSTSKKPNEPMKIELKTVKYADLGKAIRGLKGQVVVVDLWATWCISCKKEFPHLVELHEKYRGQGLVCISVSMDESEREAAAPKFLIDKKATFANYRMEEKPAIAFDLLDIKGIPVVYVFDRENRRAAKLTEVDYKKDVEPLVKKLLDAKK